MNDKMQSSLFFERVAVGFLLFSATGVTVFARSSMTWENLLMPVLLAGLASVITLRYRVALTPRFAVLLGGFFTLFIAQSLVFQSIHPKYLVLYPLNFWVCYCFVKAMHERVFLHLEFWITRLSAISLVIWSVDIVAGGKIRSSLSGIQLGQPYSPIIDSYVFFQAFVNEQVDSFLPRNSGFAWEPGAFAVFCCMGLMINLYRTNFSLERNAGAYLLLAALASSQSTTGFSILIILIIFKLWHDIMGVARIVIFPAMVVAVVVGIISLPFMQDKIENLWAQDLNQLIMSARSDWNLGEPVAAQRFLSFKLDFADFLNNPLTGYGGEDDDMTVRRFSLNIVSISGIGKILARFGIFGFAFFAWSTVISSSTVSRRFGAGGFAMLALYIFMVSISYSLIEHPLFIVLWCFAYLEGRPQKTSPNSQILEAI